LRSLGQTKTAIGFCDGGGGSAIVCTLYRTDQRVTVSWQPASVRKQTGEDGEHRWQQSGEKPAFLQNLAFRPQRRLLLGQLCEVISLSTKLSHLTRGQRYVAFYNVLGKLTNAVHKLSITLALRTYSHLALSPIFRIRFNVDRYFLVSSLILSTRRRNAYCLEKCLSADAAPRPVPVEGR